MKAPVKMSFRSADGILHSYNKNEDLPEWDKIPERVSIKHGLTKPTETGVKKSSMSFVT